MRRIHYCGVLCLMIVIATVCTAFSQGVPGGPPPSAGYSAPSHPPPQTMGQPQPGWTPPTPAYPPAQQAPQYPAAQAQSVPQTGQTYPSYPYPPHHNPYYDGAPHPNFLSQWLDYMFNLPHAIAGGVADFMDRRIFPASPATHGNQTPVPVSPAPAPSTPQAPLPPASIYEESTK